MPFGLEPSVFIVKPFNVTVVVKSWQDDNELKQAFGIELAKNHKNAFIAACEVFGKETQKALFASVNWINDPVVIEAKQNYIGVVASSQKILDKTELSLRLLLFSEEKIVYNGNEVYAAEAKDRLSALKLYAEVQGFINNKAEINNTINNAPQFMEIRFVEPDKKDVKTIEHTSEETIEENILDTSPIKLKLVG